jgi:hypothetical protein
MCWDAGMLKNPCIPAHSTLGMLGAWAADLQPNQVVNLTGGAGHDVPSPNASQPQHRPSSPQCSQALTTAKCGRGMTISCSEGNLPMEEVHLPHCLLEEMDPPPKKKPCSGLLSLAGPAPSHPQPQLAPTHSHHHPACAVLTTTLAPTRSPTPHLEPGLGCVGLARSQHLHKAARVVAAHVGVLQEDKFVCMRV